MSNANDRKFSIKLYLAYCKNMGIDYNKEKSLQEYVKWSGIKTL